MREFLKLLSSGALTLGLSSKMSRRFEDTLPIWPELCEAAGIVPEPKGEPQAIPLSTGYNLSESHSISWLP